MLANKKPGKALNRQAFTIVELIIVVVVIAILSTLVVISYNGITNSARQATIASDASSAAKLIESTRITSGSYATSINSVNNGQGIPSSQHNSYSYHSDGTYFCLTVSSDFDTIESNYVSNTNLTPTTGSCPQDLASTVETLAGDGTLGFANGSGASARLASPAALAANGTGTLYFTDGATSRIRTVTEAGLVATLAGNGNPAYVEGTGTGASFSWPQAVAVGSGGNLVIADSNNHRVRLLSASNTSSFLAGGSQGAVGTIGTVGSSIRLNTPRGITYVPSTDSIVVADTQNNRLFWLNSSGTITAVSGFTTSGYTNAQGTAARYNFPKGLASDTFGNVYVADGLNHRIRKVAPNGDVSLVAGSSSGYADNDIAASAQFNNPSALAVAGDGTIYVADTGNNRIRKIAVDGKVSTVAGSGTAGFADGLGEVAQFNAPTGIAIGSDGRLYVSDTANHRIRVMNI